MKSMRGRRGGRGERKRKKEKRETERKKSRYREEDENRGTVSKREARKINHALIATINPSA